MVFDTTAVTFTGAPPDSRVALFGVARESEAFRASLTRYDEVVVTDDKGAGRFELPDGQRVSPRSVWVAVSLVDGELAIGVPDGRKIERVDFPEGGLDAERRFFDGAGGLLDVLVVRPAAGAGGADQAGVWGLRTGDGGALDRDGVANARISLAFSDLSALADSEPSPETLQARDVLVGIEPFSLRIYAGQLTDVENE
ncbi:MAG TPA: hypothetical protein VKU40_08630 [Thermoanaerobaculia bacterium]|nr:hypothetical protein [Thermoanaerobaculia bacterium]